MSKTVKVKYVHSPIGRDKKQKETVRCLGLSRIGQVKELPDNPAVRGMIKKIPHLVELVQES